MNDRHVHFRRAGALVALTSLAAYACAGKSVQVASESAPTPATSVEEASAPAAAAVPDAAPSAEASADAAPTVREGAYAYLGPPVSNGGPPDERPDCEAELARAGVTFRPGKLPVHSQGGTVCGAPQVVTYVKGPGDIAYDPSPSLSCPMALALASFERIVQDEARRTFQSPVARVRQLGTYNCRVIAAFKSVASEHSYANAIDLAEFTLQNGRKVSVLADFFKGDGDPPKPGGAFLRSIAKRGFEEDVFSNVLTPFWDAAHRDHLHLDLARYRVNGFHPHA